MPVGLVTVVSCEAQRSPPLTYAQSVLGDRGVPSPRSARRSRRDR